MLQIPFRVVLCLITKRSSAANRIERGTQTARCHINCTLDMHSVDIGDIGAGV